MYFLGNNYKFSSRIS